KCAASAERRRTDDQPPRSRPVEVWARANSSWERAGTVWLCPVRPNRDCRAVAPRSEIPAVQPQVWWWCRDCMAEGARLWKCCAWVVQQSVAETLLDIIAAEVVIGEWW